MILDAEAALATNQTVTTGTDTGLVSENTYDLGNARDIGNGKPIYVVCVVETTLDSTGDDDPLAVELITDGDAALGSATVLQRLFTLPAVAPAGTKKVGVIAPGHSYERYLGVQFLSTNDSALSAGAVSVYLTESPDEYQSYADNITIS